MNSFWGSSRPTRTSNRLWMCASQWLGTSSMRLVRVTYSIWDSILLLRKTTLAQIIPIVPSWRANYQVNSEIAFKETRGIQLVQFSKLQLLQEMPSTLEIQTCVLTVWVQPKSTSNQPVETMEWELQSVRVQWLGKTCGAWWRLHAMMKLNAWVLSHHSLKSTVPERISVRLQEASKMDKCCVMGNKSNRSTK